MRGVHMENGIRKERTVVAYLVVHPMPLVRVGLRSLLRKNIGLDECIMEARDLNGATELLQSQADPPVDVILLGAELPDAASSHFMLSRAYRGAKVAVVCVEKTGSVDSLLQAVHPQFFIDLSLPIAELDVAFERLTGLRTHRHLTPRTTQA